MDPVDRSLPICCMCEYIARKQLRTQQTADMAKSSAYRTADVPGLTEACAMAIDEGVIVVVPAINMAIVPDALLEDYGADHPLPARGPACRRREDGRTVYFLPLPEGWTS